MPGVRGGVLYVRGEGRARLPVLLLLLLPAMDRSTRWVSAMYASCCVTDNAQEMTKSLRVVCGLIGGWCKG